MKDFTGAQQGIVVRVNYPTVQMPRELRTQSDCCNERYSLIDLEHLMKVKLYLNRHGGWTLMAVKKWELFIFLCASWTGYSWGVHN